MAENLCRATDIPICGPRRCLYRMGMRTVYLDYNATTPLDADVRAAMLPFLGEVWGNPSSVHHVGRRARALLDESRERTACVLRCKPSEIVFTSGGTESVNLAVFGAARRLKAKGRHLVTSAIEHHAALHAFEHLEREEGFEVTRLPASSEGRISLETLRQALRPDTVLVSLMAANNEIGTLQPVADFGALCRERGVVFHTDAVQWFGKEPFSNIDQFNADLVSICAHKFHGPKGAGALFIRSPFMPQSLAFGGGHENERRAGTENLAGIIGLTEALERFVHEPVFAHGRLLPLRQRLDKFIASLPGVHRLGGSERLVNTVACAVEGADSIALLAGLDLEGICASSGSACSAGSLEPSHVVRALGFSDQLSSAMLRFSLGRETIEADIEAVERALPEVIQRVRRCQPSS